MGFYENFTRLCRKAGKAPSVVAQEIGLNNSSVTYWKRGSIPKSETLRKLSEYFGVSVDDLLEDRTAENERLRTWGTFATTVEFGDSFKLDKVFFTNENTVLVTFTPAERGLTAREVVRLLAKVSSVSKTYGIEVKDITDFMESAARVLYHAKEDWQRNGASVESDRRKTESGFREDTGTDSKKGDE